jgi:seryl-tRNA synthetase
MIEIAKLFYESLSIPYEIITIVSGELNNTAAKKSF